MNKQNIVFRTTLLATVVALTACGGGGGGDSAPTTPPVAPASLTVTGTAATGAAVAAAPVSVKCVGGSGTGNTAVDGGFSVAIVGASLPCVLSVTSGSVTLRSVAEAGTATTVVANITPLSELIAAHIAGGDAATLFTTFDAAAQAKLSASGLSDARAAVTTVLQGVIDLAGVDPIKAELKAANGNNAGNALDKLLDNLGTALKAAGTDVKSVASAMQANSGAPAAVQTILRPAAASCAGLRTGKYRLLDAYASSVAEATPVITVDAAKGELTMEDGHTVVFQPVTGAACQFARTNGDRLYVAASGMGLWRHIASPTMTLTYVLLPEQSVPTKELAGTWNIVGFHTERLGGVPILQYATETLDASGKTTAGADCVGATCTAWTPDSSDVLSADAAGGFSAVYEGGARSRLFAYRTAAGQMSLVGLYFSAKGVPQGVVTAAKQQALSLPAVGDVQRFWDIDVGSTLTSTPVDTETTVNAVDLNAKTLTRKRKADGRVDTFAVNSPRDGMRYRAAGSSVLDNGTTLRFAESTAMPLPGTGVSVSSGATLNGGNFFSVSIAKP